MKIKFKKLYSTLFFLGFTTVAHAEEAVLMHNFDDTKGWFLSNPDTVAITDDKKLLIANDSGNVSMVRHRLDFSGDYTFTFDATTKVFSDKFKDALAVRLTNGTTKLELRFRNNAVFGVSPKEGGGNRYNQLFALDSQSHQYVVNVSGSVASVSIDGGESKDFNLVPDKTAPHLFLFNRGISESPAEAIVDNIVISKK